MQMLYQGIQQKDVLMGVDLVVLDWRKAPGGQVNPNTTVAWVDRAPAFGHLASNEAENPSVCLHPFLIFATFSRLSKITKVLYSCLKGTLRQLYTVNQNTVSIWVLGLVDL